MLGVVLLWLTCVEIESDVGIVWKKVRADAS